MIDQQYVLDPIGWVESELVDMQSAPKQGDEGAPDTRSPHWPNPIGLHLVTILSMDGRRVHVSNMEALNRTPIPDVKPVLCALCER